jgi:peptidoglycan/xylan/chitin deacetylase (PgdA/CDA1 family)
VTRRTGLVLLACACACEARAGDPLVLSEVAEPQTSASEVSETQSVSSAIAVLTQPTASTSIVAAPSASASAPPASMLVRQPIEHDFSVGPTFFTPAFDGSLRFALWLDVMRFSRQMRRDLGKDAHVTFFVNACFYTTQPGKSDIGKAQTRAEVLVRRALTQQAINEGHDIGNHGLGHLDGSQWTVEAWKTEMDAFHAVMDGALFEPIVESGKFVFPRFEALDTAASGEVGASCESDADCASRSCLEVTNEVKLCTQPCNLKQKCPTGTACGGPMFRDDTDVCLPPPGLPVELDGQVLFDARGEANRKHPRLSSYRIIGFRAPYLASNDAMYEALTARDYVYDTSQAASPGPPYRIGVSGGKGTLLELALMPHPGARDIPMDYNYQQVRATPDRMRADYEASLVHTHAMGHLPWNVGHHFAPWDEGAYLRVLKDTVRFTLEGCPSQDPERTPRCAGAEVVSFRELTKKLGAH